MNPIKFKIEGNVIYKIEYGEVDDESEFALEELAYAVRVDKITDFIYEKYKYPQEDQYNLKYQYRLSISWGGQNETLKFKYNDEADFTNDLSIIKKLINT